MTSNFQINTVYSDFLSKVHYQSESLESKCEYTVFIWKLFAISSNLKKKCISFYLFCLLLNRMPELILYLFIVSELDLLTKSIKKIYSSILFATSYIYIYESSIFSHYTFIVTHISALLWCLNI